MPKMTFILIDYENVHMFLCFWFLVVLWLTLWAKQLRRMDRQG
jgi:hypothetical protein